MGRVLGEEGGSDVGNVSQAGKGDSGQCWGGDLSSLEEYKVPLLVHLCRECLPACHGGVGDDSTCGYCGIGRPVNS